jgi:hypothetical protein
MPSLLEDYATEPEIASELRRSTRTLHRWRDSRTGPPYIRLHGRILYSRTSAAKWLQAQEQSGSAEA